MSLPPDESRSDDTEPAGPVDHKSTTRKRRPFKRLHNTKKASKDDIYSIQEIARLYGVEEQTVFNWFKNGLRRV